MVTTVMNGTGWSAMTATRRQHMKYELKREQAARHARAQQRAQRRLPWYAVAPAVLDARRVAESEAGSPPVAVLTDTWSRAGWRTATPL